MFKFWQLQNVKYIMINYDPHAVQQLTNIYSLSILEFLNYDLNCHWSGHQCALKGKL